MPTVWEKRIVQTLNNPAFYNHPVQTVEMLESHISWIFLAGDFVYKVKKPVNFGFLDFSTLAKRHHFCREELRLNRRFAPHLYLSVEQIGGSIDCPSLGADPPLEYAVKMRRFPQECQCDRLLTHQQLDISQLTAFAAKLAQLHQDAARVAISEPYGQPEAVLAPMLENFAQIRQRETTMEDAGQLPQLEKWTRDTYAKCEPLLKQRRATGYIRECHGDLHLANMAWFEDQPLLFDCLEFNPNLRWIDVINDIAFLVMDLDDRGRPELGWHFLNHYLQGTGDYQGLTLLNFYKVYRAMVRAKVNALRLAQEGLSIPERQQDLRLYHSYLDLALGYIDTRPRRLLITHGFSASGKSTFARELAEQSGLLHLQSDRERKRLYKLDAEARTGSPLDGGIYAPAADSATYQRLHQLAETILSAGHSVIVDATFLKHHQREPFLLLAEQKRVPVLILDFAVATEELRRRILSRSEDQTSISEAGLEVLESQLKSHQPLTERERDLCIRVDPTTTPGQIARRISHGNHMSPD
ncbi:MAG: aminoglycoside phosphotransferase [Desulfuromonas sp.]|nr:MAG: aminoglycoside phosphotransferase [Desulfuromonas sp.]